VPGPKDLSRSGQCTKLHGALTQICDPLRAYQAKIGDLFTIDVSYPVCTVVVF